jgi:hypothetical protein
MKMQTSDIGESLNVRKTIKFNFECQGQNKDITYEGLYEFDKDLNNQQELNDFNV